MNTQSDDIKKGTCGCGRSPTGDCIGWHDLTEEIYQIQRMLWFEEALKKDQETNI